MEFISLGRHCDIAFNLKKNNKTDITHFFDWIRTDFKCVLYILNLKNIDSIFNIDNLIIDDKEHLHENEYTITLKNFVEKKEVFLFHHEIQIKTDDNIDIKEKIKLFIDKYNRRYGRLMDLIKSDKKLVFIYRITENKFDYNTDVNEFNKIIKLLNKNIVYCLVILVNDASEDYYFVRFENYIKINISKYIDTNINNDWTYSHIKWLNIYDIIENNAFI